MKHFGGKITTENKSHNLKSKHKGNIKRKHSSFFKVKVSLDMIKDAESIANICSKYSIHASQAHKWKKQTAVIQKFINRLLCAKLKLSFENQLI